MLKPVDYNSKFLRNDFRLSYVLAREHFHARKTVFCCSYMQVMVRKSESGFVGCLIIMVVCLNTCSLIDGDVSLHQI
jgi:hypothetical protein